MIDIQYLEFTFKNNCMKILSVSYYFIYFWARARYLKTNIEKLTT